VPEPLRVCYVIGTLDRGGAEGQLVRLAAGLDRTRFAPYVCSLTRGGPLERTLGDAGVPVRVFGLRGLRPTRNPWAIGRELWRFVQFLREIEPDVVHGFLMHAYIPATFVARLTGVPVVVASRRSLSHFKARTHHWRLAERAANRLTDRLVANSEAVRADVIASEHVNPSLVEVIHNGIDAAEYDQPPDPALRFTLGLDERGPILAVVANLIHYKGHGYVLDALAQVRTRFPAVRALFVGEGPMRSRIEAQIARLHLQDCVALVGSRSDVAALLSQADLLVHPSTEEGFSNVILEAMATEKPVVATTVGGNAEAVVDGETGVLVPPRDAAALAAAIIGLVENPNRARAMGAAGRQRVAAVFPVARMVKAYERMYNELSHEKGRRIRATVS
jgi:glycosyltransferase involved in cell wall biosynthesis